MAGLDVTGPDDDPKNLDLDGPEHPHDKQSDLPLPVKGSRQRLIDSSAKMRQTLAPEGLVYSHSALAQLGLPYRNPGDIRRWERSQRGTSLLITAGEAMGPDGSWHEVGLPYGPRARLVLIHISTQAIHQQDPSVKLGDSLTGFARELGIEGGGRNIRDLRDQLIRLSGSTMNLGIHRPAVAPATDAWTEQTRTVIFSRLSVTWPEAPRQRKPWPETVTLAPDFYETLALHAVPLDPRALAALKHSSRALDIYTWLAYRLRRAPARGVLVNWQNLRVQFGSSTQNMGSFKRAFLTALHQVIQVYPKARVEVDPAEGLVLRDSPSPSAGHKRLGQ